MYSVMIVDDDIAVRATLKDVIEWEKLGFKIVAEAKNGKQALDILKVEEVNVLITDMKMPIMDGLELIKEINSQNILIIALSSFDEFELVRESFKLGVHDYILKINLEESYITNIMNKLKSELDQTATKISQNIRKSVLQSHLEDVSSTANDGDLYSILLIDLPEEQKRQGRFKDLKNDLIIPMHDLIMQMPNTMEQCECEEGKESLLIVRHHKKSLEPINSIRLAKQIQSVLRNYMNVNVTISITGVQEDTHTIQGAIEEAQRLISQRFVFGEGEIYYKDAKNCLDFEELDREEMRYSALLNAFHLGDNELFLLEEKRLFATMAEYNKEKLHTYCLYMIYLEGIMVQNSGDSFTNIFGKSVSYSDKLNRLICENDYIIWMYNFNRFLFEHLSKITNHKKEATFELVRRYIQDNYADESLNLTEVASIAGLNESYFSSKFKKEFGKTFVEYLKEVRINHAKKLMETTNMKIYEISQAVGYKNVEHFTRIFKTHVGVTPKQYSK